MLSIRRVSDNGSASLKLIPGNGKKGGILLQTNCREDGNQFIVIRQSESNEILNLFVASENQRLIHDYKSGTLKEILVQGEASHFQAGEVFEITGELVSFHGYISDSSRAIVITFILPKSAQGMTIGVECEKFFIRGNDGYLINGGNLSDYDFKILRIYDNIIAAHIKNKDSSKIADVNNIALVVSGNFKFTFS